MPTPEVVSTSQDAAQPQTKLEEVLGDFTTEAIERVTDATTKQILKECHAIATGIVNVYHPPGTVDPTTMAALAQRIGNSNITVETARKFAAEGLELLQAALDKDAKHQAARAATAHAATLAKKTRIELNGFVDIGRGVLGRGSTELTHIGLKPVLPKRKRAPKDKKPDSTTSDKPKS